MTSSRTPAKAIDAGIVLMRLDAQHKEAESKIHRQVKTVMALGGSWTTVGVALGISRQAAWERFGKKL